jgi:hypothetical protein
VEHEKLHANVKSVLAYQRCARVIRLKAALKSAMSLELGPKGLLVFENYTKGNNSSAQKEQRKGIPGRCHRPQGQLL